MYYMKRIDIWMNKKTVAVIFNSATKTPADTFLAALSEHHVLPIYITDSGKWLLFDNPTNNMNEAFGTSAILSPDKTHRGILRLVGGKYKAISCDAVFALTHTVEIALLCEMAGIAYITEQPKRTKPAILKQITAVCGGSK